MNKTDQLSRYERERPEFFAEIRRLESKHQITIFPKLKGRRYDFDSFQGMMVELQVGLFLDQFCDHLVYDPKIKGQTPDWLATIHGMSFIVEVARLKDTAVVERAVKEDKDAGMVSFHTLGSRPERIYGNVLSVKVEKYRELLISNGYAFIIAIYNTPTSEVHSSDAAQLLYGKSIAYQHSSRIDIDQRDTVFYSDKFPEVRELLNGVLWMDQPSFDPVTKVLHESPYIYWGNESALHPLLPISALQDIAGSHD